MQKKGGSEGNHPMQIRTPVCTRACVCSLRVSVCVRARATLPSFGETKTEWGEDDGTSSHRRSLEVKIEEEALALDVALFPSVKKMAERARPASTCRLRAGPTRDHRTRGGGGPHPHHPRATRRPPPLLLLTLRAAAARPPSGEEENPLLRLSRSSSPPSKKTREREKPRRLHRPQSDGNDACRLSRHAPPTACSRVQLLHDTVLRRQPRLRCQRFCTCPPAGLPSHPKLDLQRLCLLLLLYFSEERAPFSSLCTSLPVVSVTALLNCSS